MPAKILVFDFDERPADHTDGKACSDAILWRGRVYDRDWSDDETQDDSGRPEPTCLVTEDGARFKPAKDQSTSRIGDLYRAASPRS